MFYKLLADKTFEKCSSLLEAEMMFRDPNRILRQDKINDKFVSTVFLVIDHSGLGYPPILFETIVFDEFDKVEEECRRYSNYDEAMRGHKEICDRIAQAPQKPNETK